MLQAAYFLPCTRPPDACGSCFGRPRHRRPQGSRDRTQARAFVITRADRHRRALPLSASSGAFSSSLYSGEQFLLWALYSSLSMWFKYSLSCDLWLVFTYIHCVHTPSRSALLVYLGERTGSLLGLISLSISDFYIGSVQCLCASYICILHIIPCSVFGGRYKFVKTSIIGSTWHFDTSCVKNRANWSLEIRTMYQATYTLYVYIHHVYTHVIPSIWSGGHR